MKGCTFAIEVIENRMLLLSTSQIISKQQSGSDTLITGHRGNQVAATQNHER